MSKFTQLKGVWGILWLVATGMLLAGCSSTPSNESAFSDVPGVTGSAPANGAGASATDSVASSPDDTAGRESSAPQDLKPGDAISVVYNDLPIVTPPFEGEIKPDGTITLIHNKTFQAAGKTPSELEKEIRKTYVPDYYRQMTVQVRLNDTKRLYYVGGEVRSPGRQMYLGRVTVLKAIQSAGDFTDFANRGGVTLTRADGKQIKINCKKALENPAKYDVDVFPGDTIHVPRRFW
jgi:protein involved in polysaccharide export with SLBB domain